jgi:methylenetetrahydrofolate dehydrogenase (NADP+) / methenyltetrahydrofolate cyclohydrolase
MAELIDGKSIATEIRRETKQRIEELKARPGLGVILVGNDPASHCYVGLKQKACVEVGINSELYLDFATEPEEKILKQIEELNRRDDIHGILVQLPLPNHDEDKIIAAIDPKKDVDGFHPENVKLFEAGHPCLKPPLALGVMKLIEATGRPIEGLRACIVGSDLLAKPIVQLLDERSVSSTVIRADATDLAEQTKNADILIVAVGRPGLITGDMVKRGAIVIDIGTTRVDGKVVGDVDFQTVDPVAGWLTPVPGGVGPMTVAYLLVNVLKASTR